MTGTGGKRFATRTGPAIRWQAQVVTDQDSRQVHAGSFGAAAAEYERGRPGYPAEALDWLLPNGVRRVLDLGAGTGKLTRPLLELGLEVVAVEPLPQMRAELTRVLPTIEALAGTAESIPLPAGAVQAVLVAQAWHWVDVDRAVPEMARVLSPGGQLGLMWNERDDREDWVAELGRITRLRPDLEMDYDTVRVGAPFGPLERTEIAWTHHLDRDALVDMVASRSYVITAPSHERAKVLKDVRILLDTHPALSGTADLALPYITHCFRTRVRADTASPLGR